VDVPSWILGLSLIVLMALGLESTIRVRVDKHQPEVLRAIPTVIGHIGAVAVILAALHGLEGVLWASAYWRLGALESFTDASVYSLATMSTFEIPGITLSSRVPYVQRIGSGERRAVVRHQHGVPFCRDAGLLAGAVPPTRPVE
jgi:hypothetical protein